MTPERAKLLGELIEEMNREGGYIPDEAWLPINRAFVIPFVEVAVVRQLDSEWQLLLGHREDEFWQGWEIPGGIWKAQSQTIEDACNAVAKGELGVHVDFIRLAKVYKWTDNPRGHPLSLVCICQTDDEVQETDTKKFFGKKNLPSPWAGHHGEFVQAVFADLEKRGA